MLYFFGLVIVAVALYLIGYPLLKPALHGEHGVVKDRSQENGSEIIAKELEELEFDYRMGKISEEDYLELHRQYDSRESDDLTRPEK